MTNTATRETPAEEWTRDQFAQALGEARLRIKRLEESLEMIAQESDCAGAPIDSEAANYYAMGCQAISEIARKALLKAKIAEQP